MLLLPAACTGRWAHLAGVETGALAWALPGMMDAGAFAGAAAGAFAGAAAGQLPHACSALLQQRADVTAGRSSPGWCGHRCLCLSVAWHDRCRSLCRRSSRCLCRCSSRCLGRATAGGGRACGSIGGHKLAAAGVHARAVAHRESCTEAHDAQQRLSEGVIGFRQGCQPRSHVATLKGANWLPLASTLVL